MPSSQSTTPSLRRSRNRVPGSVVMAPRKWGPRPCDEEQSKRHAMQFN